MSGSGDSERKFIGQAGLDGFAASWLSHVCREDPAFPENTVCSIYYDTPALDSYAEKANGDFLKTKYRLRWYEPDSGADPRRRTAFMEIKSRIGEEREKTRVKLDLARDWLDRADLDDPGFDDLLRRCSPDLEKPTPLNLSATAAIRYRRRRFLCPFTFARICLDTDIGLARANGRLIPGPCYVNISSVVLEIKGIARADIPWLRALYEAGFRRRSFSKYGACMDRLARRS